MAGGGGEGSPLLMKLLTVVNYKDAFAPMVLDRPNQKKKKKDIRASINI